MGLSRRTALGSLLAAGALGLAREVAADTPAVPDEELSSAFPDLPDMWKDYADASDVAPIDLSPVPLGTGKPLAAEIEIARKIMSAAPAGTGNPLDVARYFADIGGGKTVQGVNGDVRHYVRGWPVRYNPMIVNFFAATKTYPLAISGDYTGLVRSLHKLVCRPLAGPGKGGQAGRTRTDGPICRQRPQGNQQRFLRLISVLGSGCAAVA